RCSRWPWPSASTCRGCWPPPDSAPQAPARDPWVDGGRPRPEAAEPRQGERPGHLPPVPALRQREHVQDVLPREGALPPLQLPDPPGGGALARRDRHEHDRQLRPAAGHDRGPAGPHLGGPQRAADVRAVVRGGRPHPDRLLRPQPDPLERHPPLDAAPGARRRRRPPLPPPSPEAQAPADLVAAGEPGPPPPDAATANGRPEGRPSTSGSPGRRLAAPVDDQKSSMPPGIAGACSFSGLSAMTASVVRKRPAIEAAFCSA